MQIASDDFVLAHFKRPAVTSAHMVSRMVAQYGRYRTLFILLLMGAEDFPQVARRGMHRGAVLRFDFHPVIGTVVDAALGILAYRGQSHVGPAVHLVVAHDRQLIRSTSFPTLTFSLTGADFASTTIGGIRCSSISKQASAISGRLASLGNPKAICVFRWEISQFIVSLMSLTRPFRFSGLSKMMIGNFFCAPRCLIIAVTS